MDAGLAGTQRHTVGCAVEHGAFDDRPITDWCAAAFATANMHKWPALEGDRQWLLPGARRSGLDWVSHAGRGIDQRGEELAGFIAGACRWYDSKVGRDQTTGDDVHNGANIARKP